MKFFSENNVWFSSVRIQFKMVVHNEENRAESFNSYEIS